MQIYDKFLVARIPGTGEVVSVCIDIDGEELHTFPFRQRWQTHEIVEMNFKEMMVLVKNSRFF